MNKDFLKRVRIGCEFIECTDYDTELYQITLAFDDGYRESFCRSFYDINDAQRYCILLDAVINYCIDVFYRFLKRVKVGGINYEK